MASPTTETMLYCPRCGAIHVIHRKTSKQKKAGQVIVGFVSVVNDDAIFIYFFFMKQI